MSHKASNDSFPSRAIFKMTSPKWQRTFAIWCVVLCAVLLALYRFSPPKELALDAPSTEFSSARALAHLRIFAEQPHAIGTATHARVRDYLFAELISSDLLQRFKKLRLRRNFLVQYTVPMLKIFWRAFPVDRRQNRLHWLLTMIRCLQAVGQVMTVPAWLRC